MKVGITGQRGFIGWHMSQYLHLQDDVTLVNFERSYFENSEELISFVDKCDVVLHLAAMNRHPDPNVLYRTNIDLVQKLTDACVNTKPFIYFTSSTQEYLDNQYGSSKREGWKQLSKWSKTHNANVGCFVVPNVFGPFGRPNYNSFVATFCHKLANGEEATIISDAEVELVHVHDLVKQMWQTIRLRNIGRKEVPSKYKVKVSKVLRLLETFRDDYLRNGKMPNLEDDFTLHLFNMYRTYIPSNHFPVSYDKYTDDRGIFVEIVRANTSGQFSFSTTVPGITRGNHFHTRKAERFAVIKGNAKIELRKIGTEEIIEYHLDGNSPSYVDMPIWHTHNITNIGEDELVTLFWINEPYSPDDPDTYFVEV